MTGTTVEIIDADTDEPIRMEVGTVRDHLEGDRETVAFQQVGTDRPWEVDIYIHTSDTHYNPADARVLAHAILEAADQAEARNAAAGR